MSANRVGRRANKMHSPSPNRTNGAHHPGRGGGSPAAPVPPGMRDPSTLSLPRRQARVTVKYNRKELQRRLEVEKWMDCGLEVLYAGREEAMPEEVNIDELLDLKTDEERTLRLQEILHNSNNNTELQVFIGECVLKLQGLQKQDDLHNDGIDLPQLHIHHHHGSSPRTDAAMH